MKNKTEIICPACGIGRLERSIQEYEASMPDDVKISIPDIALDVCDNCGKVFVPEESARKIDEYTRSADELLTDYELAAIREEFGVDQTAMSETLGLGGKTYHRWENGSQIPTRSMCRYLRVLNKFPEAFLWLQKKQWRKKDQIMPEKSTFDFKRSFPHLGDVSYLSAPKKITACYPPSALLRKVGM